MPIKLKANNGNIDLKVPIKQVGGGAVYSVNGMTGDVVLEIPSKTSQLENDSGYLTEHQSLADYAKKSEIPDVSGFITEIPDEYVTESELDAKGYLTEHQSLSEYAKKSELFSKDYNDLTNKPTIPSVEGLASTQYVDEKVATKQDTLTAGNNITIVDGVISATGGSGGGSYTLPVADYDILGGVKAKQTESDKKYGIVYIDSEARLRVPIARQGVDKNAGIVLPVNGQFRVEDNGDMFLRPAESTCIGGVKPDGTTTTVDTDGTIHAVMPEPYTLPTASTTTLGGVKVDGNTITITADGTITSSAGGLIGKSMNGYNQPESEWTWIADWAQHPEKYYVVIEGTSETEKDCPVIYTAVYNKYFYYYWFEGNTLHTRSITFTDNTLSQVESVSKYSDSGTVWLTEQNWNQYVTAGGGSDWYVTTSTSESNLYNAKEVVIFWKDSNYNRHQSYLNVGCDYYGNSGTNWGSSNWINTEIKLDSVDSSNNGSSITYDGSNINTIDCTIEAICYKT